MKAIKWVRLLSEHVANEGSNTESCRLTFKLTNMSLLYKYTIGSFVFEIAYVKHIVQAVRGK